MIKRTLTGIGITVVVYGIIAYAHIPQVIIFATALLNIAAVLEIFHATGKDNKRWLKNLCAAVAVLLSLWQLPLYENWILLLLPVSIFLFGWMMAHQKQCDFDRYWKTICIVLLVVLLFKAIPHLCQKEYGKLYLLMAITLCFATDVAAYLIGSRYGKHKLIPQVSPNKTVEGAVAGIVASVIVMLLFDWYWKANGVGRCEHHILYAITASVMGQFGDLSMSVIKRIGGVKDFGSFLPGHGGILDRFDSHLFCIAYTLLFCIFTGGYLV